MKHLWIAKILFLSMETFCGHENSRDILEFNENQREKKVSKNRNEQNKEEHLHANRIKDKEEDIWFHGTVFLSVWQSNQTHVGFIYMSTWYASFKAQKTKYIHTKYTILFYGFLSLILIRSQRLRKVVQKHDKKLGIWDVACYIGGLKCFIRLFIV